MEFSEFVYWGFSTLLTGTVVYLAKVLYTMEGSIQILNEYMVRQSEKIHWHEKEIDRIFDRIGALEKRIAEED